MKNRTVHLKKETVIKKCERDNTVLHRGSSAPTEANDVLSDDDTLWIEDYIEYCTREDIFKSIFFPI